MKPGLMAIGAITHSDMKPGLMAIGAITHGITPFAPMPREFTDTEAAPFRRIAGAEPIAIRAAHGSVVARDRTAVLAIHVNRANPIAGLTLDQAARIFTTGHPSGDLPHWGQLGLTANGQPGRFTRRAHRKIPASARSWSANVWADTHSHPS